MYVLHKIKLNSLGGVLISCLPLSFDHRGGYSHVQAAPVTRAFAKAGAVPTIMRGRSVDLSTPV